MLIAGIVLTSLAVATFVILNLWGNPNLGLFQVLWGPVGILIMFVTGIPGLVLLAICLVKHIIR